MLILLFVAALLLLLLADRVRPGQRKYIYMVIGTILVILIAGNSTNLDYQNYAASYDRIDYVSHASEWLYHVLKLIGNQWLHLSYDGFRVITASAAVWLLFRSFSEYVEKKSVPLLMFCLFPLFYYSTLYRTFLGLAFFLFSVRYLEELTPGNLLRFTVCMALASGLHFLYVGYLLLILCYFIDRSKVGKWTVVAAVLLSLLVALSPRTLLNVVQQVLILIDAGDRADQYAGSIGTRMGFIIWWGLQIFYYLTAKFHYDEARTYESDHVLMREEQKKFRFIKTVHDIALVSFLFCPLYRVQANFARLLLNQLPLVYLQHQALTELRGPTFTRTLRGNCAGLLAWGYHSAYTVETIVVGGLWQSVVVEMLTHNWMMGMFGA